MGRGTSSKYRDEKWLYKEDQMFSRISPRKMELFKTTKLLYSKWSNQSSETEASRVGDGLFQLHIHRILIFILYKKTLKNQKTSNKTLTIDLSKDLLKDEIRMIRKYLKISSRYLPIREM